MWNCKIIAKKNVFIKISQKPNKLKNIILKIVEL